MGIIQRLTFGFCSATAAVFVKSLRASLGLLLVSLFLVTSACGNPNDGSEDISNFEKRAEAASEEGWTPYWLGRSFEAGSRVFRGPSVADFGADVEGGGVDYAYYPAEEPLAELQIVVYSRDAWSRVKSFQDFESDQTISLLGQPARYRAIPGPVRPVEQLRLIVEVDGTVINAIAPAVGSSTPGRPDDNPLLDVDTFLSVLSHLRVYPEE